MSKDSSISCPECGAPVPFRGTAISAVCEYCNSTVVRDDVNVELIGKVSAIFDNGSPLLLNSRGSYKGQKFELIGRLQCRYERGTWNEWYLEFSDGTPGWLSDAQGQYSIMTPKHDTLRPGDVPSYVHINIGAEMTVAGIPAVVTDKRGGAYQGAEGSLPFRAEPDMDFYSVDLMGYKGEFITLDYGSDRSERKPSLYLGEAIDLKACKIHPLRIFEGWRE